MGARLALLFSLFLISGVAFAQNTRQDVTLSALGNFPFQSKGDNVTINGTNSGGAAVQYRLYFKAHSAIEAGYGYTRGTFYYDDDQTSVGGGIVTLNQGSAFHELTAAYVFHFWDSHRFKPFAVAGGGAIIFRPTGNSTSNNLFGAVTQLRGAYLYGGGVDYHITGPFTLRLEYRSLNFKTPDFYGAGLTTHSWMRSSSPLLGVAYKF